MRLVLALAAAAPALAQGPLEPPPVPPENALTQAKIDLGKALFWDEQLSATKTVACATCHVPAAGGADPRTAQAIHPGPDGVFATADDVAGSFGVIGMGADGGYAWEPRFGLQPQVTPRKAPSVFMAAYDRELFWDGRAPEQLFDPLTRALVIPAGAALERQALQPLLSEVEMTNTGTEWPDVIARIVASRPLALARRVPHALARSLGDASYPTLFGRAFGSPDVTPVRIAMALASYQRTLVPDRAPIDRWLAGDATALAPRERAGLAVFERARCAECHPAPLFTTGEFFVLGVRPPEEDSGRGAISRQAVDQGAFKVPSLRNVAERAPFMHNGGLPTLAEIIEFYDRGGDFAANRTPRIQPLHLSPDEKAALLAFLTRPLTDPRPARGEPPFDHPELYAGSNREPRGYGAGTGGSLGRPPRLIANEPALLGNRRFRMALVDGAAASPALLLLDVAAGEASLLGIRVLVGFTPNLTLLPLGLLYHGGGHGDGWQSWAMPLPGDPALAGVELFAQAIVLDAGGPQGLSATAGTHWRLFAHR